MDIRMLLVLFRETVFGIQRFQRSFITHFIALFRETAFLSTYFCCFPPSGFFTIKSHCLQQEPMRRNLLKSVRRNFHWKCLIVTIILLCCVGYVFWCRLQYNAFAHTIVRWNICLTSLVKKQLHNSKTIRSVLRLIRQTLEEGVKTK